MTNKINHFFIFLILFSISLSGFTKGLPGQDRVPGGIAIIELDNKPYKVLYKKRQVTVVENNGKWYAVLGISLSTKPGNYHVTAFYADEKHVDVGFNVKNKKYKEQHITIKNKRMVNPSDEDLKKIRQDKKVIVRSFKTWSQRENMDFNFLLPVDGRLSSPFGLRRFFNGQPRRPHSGLDIAAPQGTEIRSPVSGTVISTGNFFFNGNTVFIDHGQGLISMYCHMHTITVKPGQSVNKGESIGTVGKTGRVTGPHLHWSVSLNNTRIDPMLFLPESATKPDLPDKN